MRRRLRIWLLVLCATLAVCVQAGVVDGADAQLHVDVRVGSVGPNTQQLLREAGLEIELAVPELGRWQGWVAADRLGQLRRAPGVLTVRAPRYARFAAGAALTEGDEALNAAAARTRFNVDGSGIRIAVISDGIQGLQEAQQIGEAPKLADARGFGAGSLNGGDEGTAMIEIIHDLAPGAAISFAAVVTDLDHIAAVNHFAQIVDIIVDDVAYPLPADQRSDVSRNTTAALEHPDWPLRAYVTSAGNWAESHWSGDWRPGVDGRQLGLMTPGATHRFGVNDGRAGEESLSGSGNGFHVEHGDRILLVLFWDDAWDRSTNDYNLYLVADDGEVIASGETAQGVGIDNHEPREFIEHQYQGDDATVYAVIQNPHDDAAPVTFQLFVFNTNGPRPRFAHRTPEGSMLAQSDAAGAITVGAVNVGKQTVAAYSSRGPTLNGLPKPDVAAVDMVTVSDTTTFAPRFRGSSAAAPHVAAVAALLLEAQPALLAADGGNPYLERRLVRELLTDTARDLPPRGRDRESGAGLVDAEAALGAVISGAAVVTSPLDDGPGTLRRALASGARFILFDGRQAARTITLRSPLPQVQPHTIIDGSGWTLDASAVDVGLRLADETELWGITISGAMDAGVVVSGDDTNVSHVELERNRRGMKVFGIETSIEAVRVARNLRHGIVFEDGASGTVSSSVIEWHDQGGGIAIDPDAGDVIVGPPDEIPEARPTSSLWPPIGPLDSAAAEARTGRSHRIAGTVSIDGLPAPTGTTIDLFLDRRLAASVTTNRHSAFIATVTGPGTELRFAVNDVALEQRLAFGEGADTNLRLRAVSASRLLSANRERDRLPGGNVFRGNVVVIWVWDGGFGQAGKRLVWGNRLQDNDQLTPEGLNPPNVEAWHWSAAGLNLSGAAPDTSVVHLYSGPIGDRRFTAATEVANGRFRFTDIDIDPSASEFSLIGHDASGVLTSESDVHSLPATGAITNITPDRGFMDGGETVEICGSRIALDSSAPRVWIGNRPARVLFWSPDCISVSTPPGESGPADIALHREGARPILAIDAFEYRDERVVRLRGGWNLVTWSGPSERVGNAFAALADRDFRVYAWDQDRQLWKIYSPLLPTSINSLRTLTHDQPLMIFLDGADIDWPQPARE